MKTFSSLLKIVIHIYKLNTFYQRIKCLTIFNKLENVDKARTRTGTIASFKTHLYADVDKDFTIETDEINYMMYRRVKDVIVVILGVLDEKGKVSTTAFVYRYKDYKFIKIADKKATEMVNDMLA